MSAFTSTDVVTPVEIFYGSNDLEISPPITLASPTAYKRGAAVALNSSTNKYVGYDPNGSNNTNIIVGILIDDYDASAGNVTSGHMYVEGEFLYGKILDKDGTAVPVGMYNSEQIMVKEAK